MREELGLSLRNLAKECHISPSFLSDIELGKATPSLDTLNVISEHLNTSIAELLQENPTQSPQPESLPSCGD
jgi:transcriptional regulator with XRE-family HTH domain